MELERPLNVSDLVATTAATSPRWAFVVWRNRCFIAPSIVALIEGIYAGEPEFSRQILRGRIFTSHAPTLAEHELVRVAAKRVSVWEPALPVNSQLAVPTQLSLPPLEQASLPKSATLGMPISELQVRGLLEQMVLEQLEKQVSSPRYAQDRAVAALLVDRDGSLLAAESNTNAVIRNRHAEFNLIERRKRGGCQFALPAGSKLFVTLSPCAMCAAYIWENAEDLSQFEVRYFEEDRGTLARNTILTPGSQARARHLSSTDQYFNSRIQFQV